MKVSAKNPSWARPDLNLDTMDNFFSNQCVEKKWHFLEKQALILGCIGFWPFRDVFYVLEKIGNIRVLYKGFGSKVIHRIHEALSEGPSGDDDA